jgi:hypothetical protein
VGHVLCLTVSREQDLHDYDLKAYPAMHKSRIDKNKVRDQLKTKRNLLLEEYSKSTMNTRLAIEIRLIDDQIAEVTEQLVQQRKAGLD